MFESLKENIRSDRELDVLEVFSAAGALFKKDWLSLLLIAMASNLYSLVVKISVAAGQTSVPVFAVALPVVQAFLLPPFMLYIAKKTEDPAYGFDYAIRDARGSYWICVIVSFFYAFLTALGFFLLLLPGIYWGSIYCLAPMSTVLSRTGVLDSFRNSKALIRGSFFSVFKICMCLYMAFWLVSRLSGWTLVSGLAANLPGVLILYLLQSLVTAYYMTTLVALFRKLSSIKQDISGV